MVVYIVLATMNHPNWIILCSLKPYVHHHYHYQTINDALIVFLATIKHYIKRTIEWCFFLYSFMVALVLPIVTIVKPHLIRVCSK